MNHHDHAGRRDPSTNGRQPEPSADVEHHAAQWVCRLQHSLSPAEELKFTRWLGESELHRTVFAEMDETFRLLDLLRRPSTVVTDARPPHRTRFQLVRGFAREHPVWLSAAAMVLIAVSAWSWSRLNPRTFDCSAATAVGESLSLPLHDGSRVELNSNSSVAIQYSRSRRVVRLDHGEAFFSVSKDPARPFFVEVAGVSIRAVGTAFDVRYLADRVQVLVTAGRVRVDDDGGRSLLPPAAPNTAADETKAPFRGSETKPIESSQEPLLAAGERAEIPRALRTDVTNLAATKDSIDQRAIARALAWREQKLIFDAMPLAEVVSEFNRYNGQKIVIADFGLGTERFGGAFGVHDQEAFLYALAQGFRVEVERRQGEIILHKRR